MATLATGAISSSDTGYYAQRYSSRLYFEGVIANPINKVLSESGCINREDSLTNEGGGTVYMQNALRLLGFGNTGDGDIYSNAQLLEKSTRSINIAKNWLSITWPNKGTQTQQYAAFDIGSKNEESLSAWASSLVSAAMLNQLASNNATSITQYTVANSAFTGSDLTRITGNNAASAPTYWYSAGNQTVITSDTGITTTHLLSIKDFQIAAEVITAQQASRPTFQTLKGKPYIAVAIISMTGMNQLINEATTLGQGFQITQIYQAALAGGKEMDTSEFMLPGLPFKFVVVPDSWLPRGVVTSGLTEKANSRRCVIVGANALDVSFGKGFAPSGGKPIPGASIEFDTTYKKLNNQGYGVANLLWGCKKTTSTGPGNGSSTEYDLSTYVITHYSRQ